MAAYFLAFIWGISLLIPLVGWGTVLNRILFPRQLTDWGQRAAWGLAFSVAVGGVLNLLSCISRTTVLAYLGFGAGCWLVALLRGRPHSYAERRPSQAGGWRIYLICGAALLILMLVFYGGTVSVAKYDMPSSAWGAVRFNQSDDFQAYFNFPLKMLQVGSMGPDPFSSRRLESSLGGQAFLDTFVLSVLSVENLHLVNPGLGLLLIMGLLWGYFREQDASPGWSFAILLMLVWIDPPTINVASLYTGTAMFVSLFRTLSWKALPESSLAARTILIALSAAAICALKSNFIPACGIMLACSFLCYIAAHKLKRRAVGETAVTAILTLAFTLPWMISLYRSSGTALYPLLGRGFHQSAYKDSLCAYCWLTTSTVAQLLRKHLTDVPFVAFGVSALFYLKLLWRGSKGREAVLSLLSGAAVGHVIITIATGESFARYSFPFLLAGILVLVSELASTAHPADIGKLPAARLVAAGVVMFLVGASWDSSRILYSECLSSIQRGLSHVPLSSQREIASYQALQQSIPPGETILAKLDKPFLLDFKRNPVFLIDWAASSPPPGLPFSKGSEALAQYLRGLSIRYVTYSYGDEGTRRGLPTYFPWMKIQLLYSYDFEDNVDGLGKTRKHLYDDGQSFVLDLLQTER